MKQILLIMMLFLTTAVSAQTKKLSATKNKLEPASIVPSKAVEVDTFKIKVDSLLKQVNSLLEINNILLTQIKKHATEEERYKMYPTENIYTLLQLDTQTGKIEQVQWSLDEKSEGVFTINDVDLSFGFGYSSGSFELYPTSNMYQFILIDKTDGRKWHVQWGIGKNKRWIRRLY